MATKRREVLILKRDGEPEKKMELCFSQSDRKWAKKKETEKVEMWVDRRVVETAERMADKKDE